jgi:hypothetical protein
MRGAFQAVFRRMWQDANVERRYSQMKLQMKREALQKLDRKANESRTGFGTEKAN